MSEQDLTLTITVNRIPEEAFEALTDVRGWWSTGVTGDTRAVGDSFVFEVDGIHRCVMTATEVDPGRRLVWAVSDSWLSFIKETDEWDGTEVVFELTGVEGGTEIRFTHRGLSPVVECYETCAIGWQHYVGRSLRLLASSGAGEPHTPDLGVRDFEREALADRLG